MILDIKIKDIINSPLKKKLIKFKNNEKNFIALYGDFYITSDLFLPICSLSYCTSTDLFGFFEKKKYGSILTNKFKFKLEKNKKNIVTIKNAFVLGSTGNYYHDLIDCYSRIFSFQKNLLFHKNINKIIIGNEKTKKILKEILEVLNINIPLISLKKKEIYQFKNSTITANKRFDRTIYFYKQFFNYKKNVPKELLFISRRDTNTRQIENEPDLIHLLKNYNFKIETLDGKTFEEQQNLFNKSKIIITMHGAGLTNLLFSAKNSIVIEITMDFLNKNGDWFSKLNSREHNPYTRSMYNDMAQKCELNHYYYFAKRSKIKLQKVKFDFQKFTYTNLIVNIKFFKKFLDENLELKSNI